MSRGLTPIGDRRHHRGAPARVIDAHAHIAVPELFAEGSGLDPSVAEVREVHGHGRRLFSGGRELTSVVREFFDPSRMLDEARDDGVEHLLLSPWVQLLPVGLDAREARRRCEVQCDALARIVSSDPKRLSAIGAVPIEHPAEAVAAIRAATDAGLCGVEVPAAAANFLGTDDLEPFWSAAESLGALIFVHPATRGIPLPALDDHYLWNTIGNPMETALAAARLVMGGVLERHPDLRVLLAHGGGVLPAVRGRLSHGQTAVRPGRGLLTEAVEASMSRFYFDTITHDRVQLRRLIDDFGADRILLGSDRPFDMGDPDPLGTVAALDLPEPVEAAILGGNAERLLGLERDPISGADRDRGPRSTDSPRNPRSTRNTRSTRSTRNPRRRT